MKKPCSEMFCLRNQDITDAKAFFYLFFMSNSGYLCLWDIFMSKKVLTQGMGLNEKTTVQLKKAQLVAFILGISISASIFAQQSVASKNQQDSDFNQY